MRMTLETMVRDGWLSLRCQQLMGAFSPRLADGEDNGKEERN